MGGSRGAWMTALSHRHQAVLWEGLESCASVSGSREPRRVLEQGWDRGRLAARCGAIRAGREGTRGSTGEGSWGGRAEGDAGLGGPGHRSPWMPIMCSRMSTLSAKIFRASRSCCTPSPWGGGSRGVRATLLQRPVPARHFPLVTIVNATATTDETPRHQGWGSNSSSQTRNLKPRRAGPTARKWPSRKWPSRKWPSPGLHTALSASGLSLRLPWPPAASLCTLLSRKCPAVGRAPHTGPWVGGALLVSVPVPPIRGHSRGKARGRAQRWCLCVPGTRPTHGEGPRVSGHVNRLINEDKMTRSL